MFNKVMFLHVTGIFCAKNVIRRVLSGLISTRIYSHIVRNNSSIHSARILIHPRKLWKCTLICTPVLGVLNVLLTLTTHFYFHNYTLASVYINTVKDPTIA